MTVKLLMLVIFFAIMLGVGFYSRRHATNVNDFVLGGRGVGPWLTAFAYGTSYFSAVVFIGYAGQFGWKYGLASTWIGIGNALIGSLLGHPGAADQGHEQASLLGHHAGILRQPVPQPGHEDCCLPDYICLSHTLHSLCLQWSVPVIRHGL